MKKNVFALFMLLLLPCCNNKKEEEWKEFFLNNRENYIELARFLTENKRGIKTINNSDPDYTSLVGLKDSLHAYYNKKLFRKISYPDNKTIELEIDYVSTPSLDKEQTYYYVYSSSDSLPGNYSDHYVSKLDKNWWFVVLEDAFF